MTLFLHLLILAHKFVQNTKFQLKIIIYSSRSIHLLLALVLLHLKAMMHFNTYESNIYDRSSVFTRHIYIIAQENSLFFAFIFALFSRLGSETRVSHYTVPLGQTGLRTLFRGPTVVTRRSWNLLISNSDPSNYPKASSVADAKLIKIKYLINNLFHRNLQLKAKDLCVVEENPGRKFFKT